MRLVIALACCLLLPGSLPASVRVGEDLGDRARDILRRPRKRLRVGRPLDPAARPAPEVARASTLALLRRAEGAAQPGAGLTLAWQAVEQASADRDRAGEGLALLEVAARSLELGDPAGAEEALAWALRTWGRDPLLPDPRAGDLLVRLRGSGQLSPARYQELRARLDEIGRPAPVLREPRPGPREPFVPFCPVAPRDLLEEGPRRRHEGLRQRRAELRPGG